MKRQILNVTMMVGALALVGCPDPAADAPKAKVGEVKKAQGAASKPAAAKAGADKAGAASKPAAPAAGMEKVMIDTAASKVEWVGSKVTGKHEGGFKVFTGAIELDPKNTTASKVHVEIDTTSIYSDAEKLTGHLKSPDFFDVANHPKAVFDVTEIKAGEGGSHTLTGTLKMRGQTKSISFPAKIEVTDAAVSATAEFSINRKDFDMKYPGKPDDLIRDDVLVKLTIKAPRAKG